MSHALGRVYIVSTGEEIGCFEYNGTSDIACSTIADEDTIQADWRTGGNRRPCSCSPAVEATVRLVADYGGGIEWTSHACLVCMSITGRRDPYADDTD